MRSLTVLLVLGSTLLLGVAPAVADHPQPARNIANLDYLSPDEGFFKPGARVPTADSCLETTMGLMDGKKFKPFGENTRFSAFDSNVFEVLCLPFRAAGDESAEDPYGNGGNPEHGFCAPNPEPRPGPEAPLSSLAGECPNHQLEYIDYFEETMTEILGDFGATTRRYEFDNPGSGNTLAGRAINPAIIVPGADHPEETVVIGAHFDQTTEGPASAWDSAEGHAQVIRVAQIMADYWRSTGTRPSATVKFIPWDGEESGTLGSLDYTENNIVPGEEDQVRGYWNTDPCAGGYPAFRNGIPGQRIGLGVQIARPEEIPAEFQTDRVTTFNAAAPQIIEDIFTARDETVPTTLGDEEVFISQEEAGPRADNAPGGPVVVGDSRPVLFSSDWANFLAKGVPFFNPGPEVTGPSDENEPNNPDGIAILHTPNDNIVTLNRLTSPDPTGRTFSRGWIAGMEMCSQLLSWGMLRNDQGGTQDVTGDVVAYYEALPNEASVTEAVRFDARGSYQYADTTTRNRVPDADLEYRWDFGDGNTGTGATVDHAYSRAGVFRSTLTVRNIRTGATDTMAVPITVIGARLAAPVLDEPPAEDADGSFPLSWTFDEAAREGFEGYRLEEANDLTTVLDDPADDLAAGWEASEPTASEIQPWQHSDDASGSVRGNVRNSDPRSFYTGVDAADQRPGTGPGSGVSILTLRESFPLAQDAQLSYFTSFRNDRNDRGRVEAAIDDGGELDWRPVDELDTESDPDRFVTQSTVARDRKRLHPRTVDLAAYAGERIRLRFVYALGASQFINVLRTGWYVDDIKVDTGTFRTIGEPTAKTFEVTGRTAGTYAYRVRARYAGGLLTQASAPRTVRVTQGAPGGGPGTPGGGQPPGGGGTGTPGGGGTGGGGTAGGGGTSGSGAGDNAPPGGISAAACPDASVLRSVSARPAGGGLRFTATTRRSARVSIDVFQSSQGRTVIGNRRVARFAGRTRPFTWSGRARRGRALPDGRYFVRVTARAAGRRADVRRIVLERRGGRFVARRAFDGRESCTLLRSFKLSAPVFGGSRNQRLGIAFRLTRQARVTVTVSRGGRVVRRYRTATRRANVTHRLVLASEGLRRGEHTVRITATTQGSRRVTRVLRSQRL